MDHTLAVYTIMLTPVPQHILLLRLNLFAFPEGSYIIIIVLTPASSVNKLSCCPWAIYSDFSSLKADEYFCMLCKNDRACQSMKMEDTGLAYYVYLNGICTETRAKPREMFLCKYHYRYTYGVRPVSLKKYAKKITSVIWYLLWCLHIDWLKRSKKCVLLSLSIIITIIFVMPSVVYISRGLNAYTKNNE